MRNRRIPGSNPMPPHFIWESKKEVVFHIPGGFPVTLGIPKWMKSFPPEYKGVVVRCEETFYRLRASANESYEGGR
tara:strand:- start:348 stop:575 length:228 start_codon:yes stop_codon:yes gene_type:complete